MNIPTPVAPAPFPVLALAWGVLAGGGALLASALWQFWTNSTEYGDRFLIPLASVWLVYRRWPELQRLAPARINSVGLTLLALAVPLFVVSWFLYAQVGLKPLLQWLLAGSWLLAVAGLILVHWGGPFLYRVSFPLVFVLFALQIPDRIYVPLSSFLKHQTTNLAEWTLPVLGYPVTRDGFVLHCPHGDLGVADACSGVRSVTAILAIAALVAHLRGFGLLRGLLLLGLAVPIVAICNAARVIISGVLQEWFGSWIIEGTPHEILGVGIILLGLFLVLGMAELLNRGRVEEPAPALDTPAPPLVWTAPAGWPATVLLALAAIGTGVAQVAGQGQVEDLEQQANLKALPMQLGRWEGTDNPVPPQIKEMLTYDQVLFRTYRNPTGHAITTWVIFWSGSSGVTGYHHPDVCWPNRGWKRIHQDTIPLALPNDLAVPVTVRHFEFQGHKQMVWYWTQEGKYVWTAEDERRAYEQGTPGHVWLVDRLLGRGRAHRNARLVVLMGAELWDNTGYAEKSMKAFCADFAREVYTACPWATPDPNAKLE
jgi:EpsI family protein